MKKFIILSVLCIYCTLSFSQEIEILSANPDFISSGKQTEFYYITKELDASIGTKVADITVRAEKSGRKNNLSNIFYATWKRANQLGANAFFVSEIDYREAEKAYDMTIEIWYLNDNAIDENLDLYPKNLLVIIGDINTKNEDKGRGFKIDGEKQTIMPYQYMTSPIAQNSKVSVSVGGIIGGTGATFNWKEGRLPIFLSVGGGSVAPSASGNSVGISFSTGSLSPVDMNFGLFIMDVLDLDQTKN